MKGEQLQTEAAVLWESGGSREVGPVELDAPKSQEVLIRLVASGLCHSDEHFLTGDMPFLGPMVGGHEGAGVVEQVGPGVTTLQPGDHVVTSFLPPCGHCPSCVNGHQNLCDMGMHIAYGWQVTDQTARHHARGIDLRLFCMVGTFARHTVGHERSFIKIDDDLPLDRACLVACGVSTGWGSAVLRAQVQPGESVAVIGAGGVGSAAVQGARLAGARRIFAIDPVEFKREQALKFGATHTASSIEVAFPLIQELTSGRMCNRVICTMSVGHGEWMGVIMALAAKRGRVVVTNVHPWTETEVTMSMLDLLTMEKELVGSIFGSSNPEQDVPRLLGLYRDGLLDLDSMVTRTYPLEQIDHGYRDMREGRNIRGVLALE
jgi:S-(hydroxymethyl)glutathione dehydrogenase/alcohol dehydrogenase